MIDRSTMASEDEDQEYFLKAIQLADSSVIHGVLRALLELNVFDIMMAKAGLDGYLSPVEIASYLPTQNPQAPPILDRLLRLLATHSILNCTLVKTSPPTRTYGLTSLSKYFVRNQDGPSVAHLFLFGHSKAIADSWYCLKDTILEGGIPFNKAHEGMHIFEYLEKDRKLNQIFTEGMGKSITGAMTKILEMYNGFEEVKEVVDVGGSLGETLGTIISKYPFIKGVNFDLPHVLKHAPALPGVEHVGGDMFEAVPKGQVILLKRVLHDWKDEECLKILKNCYEALPESGKVVVIDMVLVDFPENDLVSKCVAQLDIGMLMVTHGGKERTEGEFGALAIAAGFAAYKFICHADLFGVIELYKKM